MKLEARIEGERSHNVRLELSLRRIRQRAFCELAFLTCIWHFGIVLAFKSCLGLVPGFFSSRKLVRFDYLEYQELCAVGYWVR